MATKIGVGESTRFLAKHKGTFARLAAPGGFTGERFLEKVAPALSPPEMLVEGLHVFTFNQVAGHRGVAPHAARAAHREGVSRPRPLVTNRYDHGMRL